MLIRHLRCSPDDPETLTEDLQASFDTNVIGVIKTINAFIPLLQKGREKKVSTLSTGMADIDIVNQLDITIGAPYFISKAALNLAIAKYNALYKGEGYPVYGHKPRFCGYRRTRAR